MTDSNDSSSHPRSDIRSPDAPPHAILKRSTRRAALISYLGPVVVLFVIVGIALIYWGNREPIAQTDPSAVDGGIGTTGSTDGGRPADPAFGGTREEVNFRGGTNNATPESITAGAGDILATVKAASAGSAGQRVSLRNVEVTEVNADRLWVHDGNNRVAVTIPANASTIAVNNRIDVDGTTESAPNGDVQVRATRIDRR